MNDAYRAKYNELFTELNRYMLEYPKFGKQIPQNALIVLVDESDPEFSRRNIQSAQEYLAHDDPMLADDLSDLQVVYVEVGELVPVRSRLCHPRVVARMPEYATV